MLVMMGERQADLDDLVASCRTENGKRGFAEAVACFRAGAYRACIVSTWTAVVFDYVSKLRELELAGNGAARELLVSFENARSNEDVTMSLRLELALLDDAATKFDLLTPIEKEDLERLRRDRHRCAHPSLLTLDEPYQPSAEAARAHLRHAAQHLLSRPPVQGQEAFDRTMADVLSEYFPEDSDGAKQRLGVRMSRARPTLVRRFAIALIKKLLQTRDLSEQRRCWAAFSALTSINHAEVEKLLREKMPALAENVPDSDLAWLLVFLARCELAWSAAGMCTQQRIGAFVQKSVDPRVLKVALRVPELWTLTVERMQRLEIGLVIQLALLGKVEPVDEIVRRFETNSVYKGFSPIREAFTDQRIHAFITPIHAKRLVAALHANTDLHGYYAYGSTVIEVFEAVGAPGPTTIDDWRPVHSRLMKSFPRAAKKLHEHFSELPAPPDELSQSQGDHSPHVDVDDTSGAG